ncbi:MAG: hypothetical protein C4543_03165 [Ignavibacteriales bacterium]|jgi:hypothetical protein|nr:MAG: hypothetical protein C4543_03165 [Ignavibacteriales bacterium]
MKGKDLISILFLLLLLGCSDSVTDIEDNLKNEIVLFYGYEMDSEIISIYTMNTDGSNLKTIYTGSRSYPTWFEYEKSIITISRPNYSGGVYDYNLEKLEIVDNQIVSTIVKSNIDKNVLFLRYSQRHNSIFCSYYEDAISKIGCFDLSTNSLFEVSSTNYDQRNPVFSNVDDWIYFSTRIDETYDIYRMKKDGSQYQPVLIDPVYDLTTFSVSYDGSLLVTSRYNSVNSYLTVYDIQNSEIVIDIDVSRFGMALYPNFTKDNNKILFVNGTPNNYNVARNIHIVDVDGKNHSQLTYFQNQIINRPLSW